MGCDYIGTGLFGHKAVTCPLTIALTKLDEGTLNNKSIMTSITVALLLIVAAADTYAAASDYPPLFGSRERRYDDLKPFKKWTDMLERHAQANNTNGRPCDPFFHDSCELPKWLDFLESIENLDRLEKIKAINDYHNQAKYLTDPINWKMEDYWEIPDEFFKRNGDCEDFAISKYMSLKNSGFDAADMRVVVVQDLNLNVGHAILVVYHEGQALLLDNQVSQVIAADKVRHYKIQYSINENYWWRHR